MYNEVLGNGCSANKSERQSQVEEQLTDMDKSIYRLSEMADRLEARLSGVLRRDGECAVAGCQSAPEQSLVPTADLIRMLKRRISDVSDRLDSIFMRTEL